MSAGSSLDAEGANFKEVSRRLLAQEGLPELQPVSPTLDDLMAEGARLVAEQDAVNQHKLSEDYMRGASRSGPRGPSLLGLMG